MSKSVQYKTERQCGYSKRHLQRIIKNLTEKECEDYLVKLQNQSSNDSSSIAVPGSSHEKIYDR